jgi:branched-chain amino acid transport system substrate-binding protein
MPIRDIIIMNNFRGITKATVIIIAAIVIIAATGAGVYFAYFYAPAPPVTPAEIKIGVLVPKTGEFSSAGIVMENAAKLAEKHAKEMGYNIKVIIRDCGDKPETTKVAFLELVSEGVSAIVGTYSSPQALIAADIANETKVIFIASVAAADLESKVKAGNKYVFRNAYNTSYWGILATEFLKVTNASNYYLVGYEPLKTFNMGIFDIIKKLSNAKLIGESWIKSPSVSPEDYKKVAQELANKNIGVIILGDPGPTSVNFVKEYRMAGGNATIYSVGGTLALPNVLRELNINGIAFQAAALESKIKTNLTKKYFEDYRKEFGTEANNYAGILTYDAILIVAQAVAKKGDLISNLEKETFIGAAGIYEFSKTHQAKWGSEKLRGTIAIFKDGKIEVIL